MHTQKIMLDFYKNDYKTIMVKQYDKNSRALNITCTSDGSVYKLNNSEHTCKIKMLTSKERALYKSATILDDGTILIIFDDDMLYDPGTGKLEVELFDAENNSRLSTMILNVVVVGSVYPDDEIIASEEFSALTELLNKLESYNLFGDFVSDTEPTLEDLTFWMQKY